MRGILRFYAQRIAGIRCSARDRDYFEREGRDRVSSPARLRFPEQRR